MGQADAKHISSAGTFISKYFFPVLLLCLTIFFALAPILSPGLVKIGKSQTELEAYSTEYFFTLLGMSVLTGFVVYYFGRLRDVWMDDETLWVRAYWKKIVVPLTQIRDVRVNNDRSNSITILLSKETVLGNEVWFYPTAAGTVKSRSQNMAEQILAAASAAKRHSKSSLKGNKHKSAS